MPYALTPDKVKLYYEEVGQGTPILFVHEFAGDHRSWERQLREFGKRYRCIAYAARGYRPSEVPVDAAAYTYQHVMRDAVAVLNHLNIERAHLIGLSMGELTLYCRLHLIIRAAFVLWRLPVPVPAASVGTPKNSTSVRANLLCNSSAMVLPRWRQLMAVVRAASPLS